MISSTPPQPRNSFRALDDSPTPNGPTPPPGISIEPTSGLYGQLGLFEVIVDGATRYMTEHDISSTLLHVRNSAAPAAPIPATTWQPKSNDDIVLVGMNRSGKAEADSLRRPGINVIHVKDAKSTDKLNDKIEVGGRTFDLASLAGAQDFAVTLGLPPDQTQKIADAIFSAGAGARDELAQLAQVWAQAEKGGQVPSRLVLSGHSGGFGDVFGDDNGTLEFAAIAKLAAAMPHAARSVQDLSVAACYCGGNKTMEAYRKAFPNVQTILAYTGSSPGIDEGSRDHLQRWERATRGDVDTIDRKIVADAYKGGNAAVWSVKGGYVPPSKWVSLADTQMAIAAHRSVFDRAFSGEEPVRDPQRGPLRDYYNAQQHLLQHPDFDMSSPAFLQAMHDKDKTRHLLFYTEKIAPKFAETHREKINAGFLALGLAVPNFAKLSRKDALAAIAGYERAFAAAKPPAQAARELLPLLTEGLRDLKSSQIPAGWI